MGTPIDSSLFLCQRCESILQPGSNCTVRIVKNGTKKKKKQRKNSSVRPQNKVVYTCNFCLHRNLKRGTLKNQMKGILPAGLKVSGSSTKRRNSWSSLKELAESNVHKNDIAAIANLIIPFRL
ncbi:hypothetical protein MKW98_030659 [Papaver atlanticum]|uniref:Uncharacterized protein n=1 Tax=Papaver atlanticum TaxID=357466 RepID=A0AAD4X3L3_9MAGN|nr:hypothetical protein MKW98_030659 [Papaver atlanticum]